MLDLAIIGSGPAALTAAIYSARAGLSVTIFEREKIGGALTEISNLANFPGFSGEGQNLADKMRSQAESAGAKISYGECKKIEKKDSTFSLEIDDETISARSVLVATGSEYSPLELETSRPVHYCALCDGPLYKGKNLLVVGGGNSAVGEAIYLSGLASSLTIISRSPLHAEQSLIDSLKSKNNITILENRELTSDFADSFDAIFAFIGKRPATTFLDKKLLDEAGYVLVNKNNMTSLPGLFAAGDVRSEAVRQAITAAGDGAATSLSIANYLKR